MSVPGPPVIRPRPRVTNNTYEVWWQPPVSDGGSPITGYVLECPSVYVNTYAPTDRYAIITGYLPTNTDFTFTLLATNANENGAVATFRTVRLGNPPDAPTAPSVTRDASGVATFSWTNPAYTGGIPLGWNVVTAFPIDASGSVQKWNTFGTDETLTLGAGNPTTLNPEKTYVGLIQGRNDVSFCPRTTFTAPITFGYLPTDISGLTLWLDAADANTLYSDLAATQKVGFRLDGQPVAAWRDKASNAKFVATGAAPDYATVNIKGINSTYPSVRFTQASKQLDVSGSVTLTTHNRMTYFAVIQLISATDDIYMMNLVNGNSVIVNLAFEPLRFSGTGSYILRMDGTVNGSTQIANTGAPFQIDVYADASTTNANQIHPASVAYTDTRTGGSLNTAYTGSIGQGTGTYDLRVSEILVYDRNLDSTERGQINTYLTRKWGLP